VKAILWTRMDGAVVIAAVVAVSVLALVVGVLTAPLAEAEIPTALGSGSEWKCHRLPFIQICDHVVQVKGLPKEAELYAGLKASGVSFETQ
jgi:hypothetical protein